MFIVNPELEKVSELSLSAPESCLSLPGLHPVNITRSIAVTVTGRDHRGQKLRYPLTGKEARVVQHEIDHLDGILIADRAGQERV
jgi:peptide deformylase